MMFHSESSISVATAESRKLSTSKGVDLSTDVVKILQVINCYYTVNISLLYLCNSISVNYLIHHRYILYSKRILLSMHPCTAGHLYKSYNNHRSLTIQGSMQQHSVLNSRSNLKTSSHNRCDFVSLLV